MVAIEFIMCSTYSAHTENVKKTFIKLKTLKKNCNQCILII